MLENNFVLAIVVIIILLIFISGLNTWLTKSSQPTLNHQKYQKQWKIIMEQKSSSLSWNLAIINADKLLDEALLDWRYQGETMAQRLVKAESKLRDVYQDVWKAHKLRNRLVHEIDCEVDKRQVKASLQSFQRALKLLGVKLS